MHTSCDETTGMAPAIPGTLKKHQTIEDIVGVYHSYEERVRYYKYLGKLECKTPRLNSIDAYFNASI
jgi:hypothetical protein